MDERSTDTQDLAVLAEESALSVPGVYALGTRGVVRKAQDILRRESNPVRGVRLTDDGDQGVSVDLYLIVRYGTTIPEVAWNVQKQVTQELEAVPDVKLKEVNIHIQGVHAE
ncbi:MAG: Asp23/Gls24 family envelope stress response protein [Clostridiales Family XIII bacterium]|jgi:uncharacterized alkaline shock family protein YloU|nr:Asp23/Gls24 family envelope stress response protein [Clostridiales Family XIII bacterium]